MSEISRVAIVGFGEVGQILAADLQSAGVKQVAVWDIAFSDPASLPSLALAKCSVASAESAEGAARGAHLVISAVTAANCLAAARAVAPGLAPDAFFLDLNSSSPRVKLMASNAIELARGRYVEAAVMSPISPKGIASPMLLGGPHAKDFLTAAARVGFAGARHYSEEIGSAAATKLCRSVVIKGLEALLTEALIAARHYDVADEVLASLSNLLPLPDWKETAHYMISRAVEHGVRRAEEMREAARTVEEAGLEPLMSRAVAERQDWAGARHAALAPDLNALLASLTLQDRSHPEMSRP